MTNLNTFEMNEISGGSSSDAMFNPCGAGYGEDCTLELGMKA